MGQRSSSPAMENFLCFLVSIKIFPVQITPGEFICVASLIHEKHLPLYMRRQKDAVFLIFYYRTHSSAFFFSFLSITSGLYSQPVGWCFGFPIDERTKNTTVPPPGSFLTSSGKGSYSSKMSISLWLVQQENMSDITKPGTGGTKTHSSLLTVKAWALSTKSLSLSLF